MVVDWKVEVIYDLLLPQALLSQEDRGGPVGLRLFFPSLVPGSLLFGAALNRMKRRRKVNLSLGFFPIGICLFGDVRIMIING